MVDNTVTSFHSKISFVDSIWRFYLIQVLLFCCYEAFIGMEDYKQNDYYDDKKPTAEEEDDNEMANDNNDKQVDDKNINKQDDDDKAEQKKWYYKARFMLDWVNKFSRTHCFHPGFAISIDEMMELFKDCLTMTHRMKKKLTKEGFKFYAMVCV